MATKLTIIFVVLVIGIGSGIAAILGVVFATKLGVEEKLKPDDGLEDPKAQVRESQNELSGGRDELEDTQSSIVQSGADLSNLTLSAEKAKSQLTLDSKAINIITKIDSDMEVVSNLLSESQNSIQNNDYELALDSIEDARVKMSKIVGEQRQLLIILEGRSRESVDSSRLDSNNTTPEQGDLHAFCEEVFKTSKLHLAVFEDIIDMIDNVSDLMSESKQLWSQESLTEDVVQLDKKYHDKVATITQRDLLELANLPQTDETGDYSSITTDILDVIEKLNTLYEEDLKSLESLSEDESILDFQSIYTSTEDLAKLDALRQYALERINEDRKSFNLPPVDISPNIAAQIHAEDVFKTGKISHWMTNGEKPYMTYTRAGGNGSVFQNVAVGGYSNYQDCLSGLSGECTKFDQFESIDTLEYEMVYNDLECCDDGHKYNIVDGHHNRVSIGLAYNDYFLVIVQNFENDYIELDGPLFRDVDTADIPRTVANVTGRLSENYRIFGITVNYDELPTQSVYSLNKDKNHYDAGQTVAVVQPNNSLVSYDKQFLLEDGYLTIEAGRWIEENHHTFSIEFDLSDIKNEEGIATKDGVYTIFVWVEDPWSEDVFEAVTYSVFLE